MRAQEGPAFPPFHEFVAPRQGSQAELADTVQHRRPKFVGVGPGERLVFQHQRTQPPPATRQYGPVARTPLHDLLGHEARVRAAQDARLERAHVGVSHTV